MFSDTITVFCLHNDTWYSYVLTGVDAVGIINGSTATALNGITNSDGGIVLIPSRANQQIGQLQYVPPKEYAAASDIEMLITFQPQLGFIVLGNHAKAPVDDTAYEDGFYNDINKQRDGVYHITSAKYYGLIPHFEIEVR